MEHRSQNYIAMQQVNLNILDLQEKQSILLQQKTNLNYTKLKQDLLKSIQDMQKMMNDHPMVKFTYDLDYETKRRQQMEILFQRSEQTAQRQKEIQNMLKKIETLKQKKRVTATPKKQQLQQQQQQTQQLSKVSNIQRGTTLLYNHLTSGVYSRNQILSNSTMNKKIETVAEERGIEIEEMMHTEQVHIQWEQTKSKIQQWIDLQNKT